MILTCSRAFSGEIIAQGTEGTPPPCATAIARSASMTPAIGASRMGDSVLKRSRILRSGHILFSFAGVLAAGLRSRLEVTPPAQDLISFAGNPLDNLGRGRNIVNQADRLAGDDGGDVEVAGSF